jgi:hypothetical protein
MKLKGLHFADIAEIQEAVTDELKKAQKEEFSAVLRNCTTAQKPVCMPVDLLLNKKVVSLPHVSSIFKNISPKTFVPHCVWFASRIILKQRNAFDFLTYSVNGSFARVPRLPSRSEPRPYALPCVPFIFLDGFFVHGYDSSSFYYLL